HLGAIFDHHALGEETLHGLRVLHQSDVTHHFGPEARINKVQDGVLNAADVLVDGKPVTRLLGIERRFAIASVGVAIKVPGGIYERVHGVGFATRRSAATGTSRVHKFGYACQWSHPEERCQLSPARAQEGLSQGQEQCRTSRNREWESGFPSNVGEKSP